MKMKVKTKKIGGIGRAHNGEWTRKTVEPTLKPVKKIKKNLAKTKFNKKA